MKKIVMSFMIMFVFLFSTNINAQTYKNEISFKYSQMTVPQGAYLFGGVMGVLFTLGHFTFENTVMTGTAAVEYTRNVNSWFGYGGTAFAEYITSDSYSVNSDGEKTPNGKYNMGVVSVMPTVKFTWFDKPHVGMYSRVGVGAGLVLGSDTQVIPSFQVSPVCVEYGKNDLRGIAEIGLGMQGCITVGLKKSF